MNFIDDIVSQKPYYINEKGIIWWIDEDINNYLKESKLYPKYSGFIVKDNDSISRVLVNNTSYQVEYSSQELEAMACHVDILRLAEEMEE